MCAFTGSQKILWPLCSSTWASNSMWRVRPILEGASSTMPTPGIPICSCPTFTSLSTLRTTAIMMLSAWASISRYLSQISLSCQHCFNDSSRSLLLSSPSDQDITKWYLREFFVIQFYVYPEIKCYKYCASFEKLHCRSDKLINEVDVFCGEQGVLLGL